MPSGRLWVDSHSAVIGVDFLNSERHIGGTIVIDIIFRPVAFAYVLKRFAHGVIESGSDQRDFIRALAELVHEILRNFSTGGFNSFYQKLALAFFISSVHAAEPDMRKVFDPFKV